MDRVVERAGALDVHKAQVTATVRTPGEGGGRRRQETREFKTTVRGLLGLHDWLAANGVTVVAMEATGVYWRPVWHVLEADFELMLCNAAHGDVQLNSDVAQTHTGIVGDADQGASVVSQEAPRGSHLLPHYQYNLLVHACAHIFSRLCLLVGGCCCRLVGRAATNRSSHGAPESQK